MKFIKVKSLFFIIFSSIIFIHVFVEGAEAEDQGFYVEPKGGAVYVDRSKDFAMGDVLRNTGPGTNVNLDRVEFGTDGWGAGYGLVIGNNMEGALGIEGGFEQYFVSFDEYRNDLPFNPFGGSWSAMPFIDGGHGVSGNGYIMGFSPIDYRMEYSMMHLSAGIAIVYDVIKKEDFILRLYGGPVYSRFSQKYEVETNGGSLLIVGPNLNTSSTTDEKLIDDLFGGRVGIRGKKGIFEKLSFVFDGAFDMYFRHSEFKGKQELVNALTSDAVWVLSGPENATLRKKETDNDFVPRFSANAGLEYEIVPGAFIRLFYQFDAWWNLTYISNPRVSTARGPVPLTYVFSQDGSAGIKTENIISHALGGEMVITF